jgi:hypothetical protein
VDILLIENNSLFGMPGPLYDSTTYRFGMRPELKNMVGSDWLSDVIPKCNFRGFAKHINLFECSVIMRRSDICDFEQPCQWAAGWNK